MPSSSSSTRSASGGHARGPSSSPGPASGGPSSPSASASSSNAGLVTEGDVGPEHRRPAAAPAHVPGRRRLPPRRRPRRDQHRRRSDDARRPDPRPPRRAGPDRGRARGRVSTGSTSCSTALLRTTQGLPGRLWGIGIGVPGPVEFESGRPISPPIMPGWDGYPIRERFAARYGAPVWVDNDVNVLALGRVAVGRRGRPRQRRRRQDRDGDRRRDHLGRPPASRRAGQRRRRRPHPGRPTTRSVVCRCGNIGCLEALAGGAALGRAGEAAALEGRSPRLRTALDQRGTVTAEDVARAASFGDPIAVALLGDGRPARRVRCSRASSTSSTHR